MHWEPYDPAWLVILAHEQYPNDGWLAEALARCTRCARESAAYLYFVDLVRPNQPGSTWQFVANIDLYSPTEGMLILDVLSEQRIGGVEMLRHLSSRLPILAR